MGIFRSIPFSGVLLAGLLALNFLLTPLCSAQTAQQIMDAACANEIRQQTIGALWESTSERRSGGHIIVERTIETVDGDIDQFVSIDGHPPDGAEKTKNDKELQGLLKSAKAREAKHASMLTENEDAASIMRVLPKMFLLEDRGQTDGVETIAFRPDPTFQPQTLEQRAVHSMSGTFYVERKTMRFTEIDAMVVEQVQFGFGLLGTLNKGGTYTLQRVEVAPGVWKTKSRKIHLDGRIALLKNISRQSEEVKSGWHPVAPNTTVLQALTMLGLHP